MAQIKLNATYGLTGTLPAVSGANLTGIITGKIGQVSAMAKTYTQTAFTTTTLTDWSGMTCALTPVATSSKIIVMGTAHIYNSTGDNVNIMLFRDNGGGFGALYALGDYINLTSTGGSQLLPICFVDSPSVTVEVSYKLQYRSDGGAQGYLNVNDGGNSSTNQEGSNSYIYCMEVLA